MRKILLTLIAFVLLGFYANAQQSTTVQIFDLGTMANTTVDSSYVKFPAGWSIDSISVTFVGSGELNVDSLVFYKAVNVDGKWVPDVSVLGTFTVTLDLADGVADLEQLYSSNATILTGAALRGLNGLKFRTWGAGAGGNDATDTGQNGWVVLTYWGTKN